jgi:hypothetical protein
MFANLNKKIELAANMTIIAVGMLLCVVVVKNHLLDRQDTNVKAEVSQKQQVAQRIAIGTNLGSLDVDWKQSRQTLVLAISSTCHFCTDSAPFYKTLVQAKKDTRVVAVLPQSAEEGKSYLQKLGVTVDEVRQLPLDKIGVHGTPTLMLVDNSGAVKGSWVGKLSGESQADVLQRLQF